MESSSNCLYKESETYVYGITSLVWLISFIIWDLNFRLYNPVYANILHKIISGTALLKFLQVFFSFMARVSCNSTKLFEFCQLAEACIDPLFNTSLFITLLLISKGVGYTRKKIEKEEINLIAVMSAGTYIVFSFYLMNSGWNIVLIILTGVVLWLLININSIRMALLLKEKIEYMRRRKLINLAQSIETRFSKLKIFLGIFQVYMFVYLLYFLWLEFLKKNKDQSDGLFLMSLYEGKDLFGLLGIGIVFWPKYNGQFFEIADFGGKGEAEVFESDGKGNEELQGNETTVLVKVPYSYEGCYENYLVASLMSLSYYKENENQLEISLIQDRLRY